MLNSAEELDERIAKAETDLAAADQDVAAAVQKLAQLADRDALKQALEQAVARAETLDEDVQEARNRETQARTLHGQLETSAKELRAVAEAADGRDVATCEQVLGKIRGDRDEALVASRAADTAVDQARSTLAEAQEGGGGVAGAVRDCLVGAGVAAEVLLDAVTIVDDDERPDPRGFWEPRLAPFTDAVIIAPAHRYTAVAAAPAGAILVLGASDHGPLPDGIAAAPPNARRFLRALAASGASETDPDRVTFTGLGVTVVGGFAHPILGRDARVAAARDELARREADQARAGEALQAAERAVELAQHAVKAARAAEELTGIRGRLDELDATLDAAVTELEALLPQQHGADEVRRRAQNAVENHDAARERAEQQLHQARTDHQKREEERNDLAEHRAALQVAYWQDGWGETREEAKDALADEPRSENRLRRIASDRLQQALGKLGIDSDGTGAPTEEIAQVARRREALEAEVSGEPSRRVANFATATAPLRDWLDAREDTDRLVEDTIRRSRVERTDQLSALDDEHRDLAETLAQIQDAVEQRITQTLQEIARELDRLDRAAEGFGADLQIDSRRPDGPAGVWEWRVTPLWRRAAGGRLVRYDNQTNSAREKLFTVHLVLAALLAAPDPTGRVLLLDELGDSLGVTHRRDVLAAVAEVARERGVTVLGTCQDAVLPDATRVAGEILYFSYPSRAELLNHPVRCWGFDAHRQRVELTGDALRSGRPPV